MFNYTSPFGSRVLKVWKRLGNEEKYYGLELDFKEIYNNLHLELRYLVQERNILQTRDVRLTDPWMGSLITLGHMQSSALIIMKLVWGKYDLWTLENQ